MGQRPRAHDRDRGDHELRADRSDVDAMVAVRGVSSDASVGGCGVGTCHLVSEGARACGACGYVWGWMGG